MPGIMLEHCVLCILPWAVTLEESMSWGGNGKQKWEKNKKKEIADISKYQISLTFPVEISL